MFTKKDRTQIAKTAPAPQPAPAEVGTGGWFRGFGGAKASGGGSWINPGSYLLRILSLQRGTSENPETLNHELFIAEFEVVEVFAAFERDAGPAGSEGWGASNKVGEQVTSVQNTTKQHKMAFGNIKNLLLAIARNEDPQILESDISEDEWISALVEAVKPPGDKYRGALVRCNATKKLTKVGRKPFTRLNFGPGGAADPGEGGAEE